MNPTHYIFTRFSILDTKFKGFRLTRNNNEDIIKEILFDPGRLDFKFNVFDKMTYQSIVNQKYNRFVWYIYASSFLPDIYKTKLLAYEKNNIRVIFVDNFTQMNNHITTLLIDKTNYTTLRLDDDDGLNQDYLEKLNIYSDQTGKVVTFPHGRKFTIENNKIIIGKNMTSLCNAFGLAGIGFNILSAGDHTKIKEKYDVIVDNTPDFYCCCCSDYCDTKRKM
jgi:hypothetical protein